MALPDWTHIMLKVPYAGASKASSWDDCGVWPVSSKPMLLVFRSDGCSFSSTALSVYQLIRSITDVLFPNHATHLFLILIYSLLRSYFCRAFSIRFLVQIFYSAPLLIDKLWSFVILLLCASVYNMHSTTIILLQHQPHICTFINLCIIHYRTLEGNGVAPLLRSFSLTICNPVYPGVKCADEAVAHFKHQCKHLHKLLVQIAS